MKFMKFVEQNCRKRWYLFHIVLTRESLLLFVLPGVLLESLARVKIQYHLVSLAVVFGLQEVTNAALEFLLQKPAGVHLHFFVSIAIIVKFCLHDAFTNLPPYFCAWVQELQLRVVVKRERNCSVLSVVRD